MTRTRSSRRQPSLPRADVFHVSGLTTAITSRYVQALEATTVAERVAVMRELLVGEELITAALALLWEGNSCPKPTK